MHTFNSSCIITFQLLKLESLWAVNVFDSCTQTQLMKFNHPQTNYVTLQEVHNLGFYLLQSWCKNFSTRIKASSYNLLSPANIYQGKNSISRKSRASNTYIRSTITESTRGMNLPIRSASTASFGLLFSAAAPWWTLLISLWFCQISLVMQNKPICSAMCLGADASHLGEAV